MEQGKWVRAALEFKTMTYQSLGEALGVTKGTVSGWVNGHWKPSWDQMIKISEVTGYPLPAQALQPLRNDPVTNQDSPTSQAQPLSDSDLRMSSKPMSWEEMMEADQCGVLRGQFQVRLKDDAMAPDFPAGMVIMFDTERKPVFGKRVLVRDARGKLHFRLYSESHESAWCAIAKQDGFLSYGPEDGAVIVAMKVGHVVEAS